jgi:hypothetical protein
LQYPNHFPLFNKKLSQFFFFLIPQNLLLQLKIPKRRHGNEAINKLWGEKKWGNGLVPQLNYHLPVSQIVSFNFLPPTVSSLNFKSIPTHNKNLNILLNPSIGKETLAFWLTKIKDKDLQREVLIYIYYGDNIFKQLIQIDKAFKKKNTTFFKVWALKNSQIQEIFINWVLFNESQIFKFCNEYISLSSLLGWA